MFWVRIRIYARAATLVGVMWALLTTPTVKPFEASSYASVGASTLAPWSWVDFCLRYQGECDGGAAQALDIDLSPDATKEISRVNRWVNENVQSESDMDHWGLAERWDYPIDGKGACHDYALLKRKLLIEFGFPRQALLMTIVTDRDGEGHAVLTIRTDKGDLVLDNVTSEIKPWTATGYRFLQRQSQEDPNVWLTIGPPMEARL